MAVRTTAAQDLDAKISDLLTSLDTYLALANQTGESSNTVANYFWATLVSKLVTRARMKPLLVSNPRDFTAYIAAPAVNTIESRDHLA